MHELEKALRGVDVLFHQAAQRRAVLKVVVPVQGVRRLAVESEEVDEKEGDPIVDQPPDPAVGRVKGVVEIENPCRHICEACPQGILGRAWNASAGSRRRRETRRTCPKVLRLIERRERFSPRPAPGKRKKAASGKKPSNSMTARRGKRPSTHARPPCASRSTAQRARRPQERARKARLARRRRRARRTRSRSARNA